VVQPHVVVTRHLDVPFEHANSLFAEFWASSIAHALNRPFAGPVPQAVSAGTYRQRKKISPLGGYVDTVITLRPATDGGTEVIYERSGHGLTCAVMRPINPMAWRSLFGLWHSAFEKFLGPSSRGRVVA
jgi:hypothetical protein